MSSRGGWEAFSATESFEVQRTVFARYGSFELYTSLLKSASVLCSVWTLSSAVTLGSARMFLINLTTRSRPACCSYFSNRSELLPSRRFHVIVDRVLPSDCSRPDVTVLVTVGQVLSDAG